MHLAQMREEAAAREALREEPAREEPVREEPVRMEAAPAPAPQPAPARLDPKEILESAGLQMVETNAAKVRQAAITPEPVQLGRPRREKPVAQTTSDELVQIETRK